MASVSSKQKMERETLNVVCPYDRSHIIHKCRLQRHLMKCGKNYPPNYLETCPYNATHLMPARELEKHIELCDDRKYIDPARFSFTLKNHGSLRSCPPSEAENVGGIFDDIWEDDEIHGDTTSVTYAAAPATASVPLQPPSAFEMIEKKVFASHAPRSRSAAMMFDDTDNESVIDDSVSITSSSMGRGMVNKALIHNFQIVGRSRNQFDITRAGVSASSDLSDVESVISEASGRGIAKVSQYMRNLPRIGEYSQERPSAGHGGPIERF